MTEVVTDLGLSFELDMDINLAGPGVRPAVWQQIRFNTAIAPSFPPTLIDTATYTDKGAANQTRIGETGTIGCTIQQRRLPDGTYLPEVQALLDAAKPGVRGNAASVEVRVYDSLGADYAFQGIFSVQFDRGTTGNAEAGSWAATFTSKGRVQAIENPGTGDPATAKPFITSALPGAAKAGDLLTISGSGFTGITEPTGVKVGTVNATSYTVVADNKIVAVVPAGSAGAANITVTHSANGTSDAFAYTRGA